MVGMTITRLVADFVTIHDTTGREIHRQPVVGGQAVTWSPDRKMTVLAYVWHRGLRIGPNPPMFKTLRPSDVLTVPVELTVSGV